MKLTSPPAARPFEMAPGSHRFPVAEAQRMIASGVLPLRRLLMRRGDVLVRDPCCLHRGAPRRGRRRHSAASFPDPIQPNK
jgi:hypothetical protein